MGLPFRHNTLGGLRVVDAGRAASSTKPVDLSRVDALPKSERWTSLQQGLSFYKHYPVQIGPIHTVERLLQTDLSLETRRAYSYGGAVAPNCLLSLSTDLATMIFNHREQVKHSQWSLLHQSMQSSIDDINARWCVCAYCWCRCFLSLNEWCVIFGNSSIHCPTIHANHDNKDSFKDLLIHSVRFYGLRTQCYHRMFGNLCHKFGAKSEQFEVSIPTQTHSKQILWTPPSQQHTQASNHNAQLFNWKLPSNQCHRRIQNLFNSNSSKIINYDHGHPTKE